MTDAAGSQHSVPSRREIAAIAAVTVGVLLTRLPFLSADYGLDPDGWRVAAVAKQIARGAEYAASRLPGYPVHEYLLALMPHGTDPRVSNWLSALASTVAFVYFTLILRHFQVRDSLLLAAAFAMTPVVFINSTITMDYLPAIALVLGGTYFALVERPLPAGIHIGLAIGCRITSGAMLLPLAVAIFLGSADRARAIRHCLTFCTVALLAGGVSFAPVVNRYGLGFFTFYDNSAYPAWDELARLGLWQVWGQAARLGFLALLCLLLLVLPQVLRALRRTEVRTGLVLSILVIVLYVAAFLRLPQDSAYLLPIVPFVILCVALLTPRWYARIFALLLLASSFITLDKQGVHVPGPAVEYARHRRSAVEATAETLAKAERLPEGAVIVAGWELPRILAALDWAGEQTKHEFVYLIEDEQVLRRHRQEGRAVRYLPQMERFNRELHGIDLRALGAEELK